MADPSVTVMRGPFEVAWPAEKKTPGPAYALPISRALPRVYSTDAHFVQYTSPVGFRLRNEALERGVVATISVIVFDVDCPEVHGSKESAPPSWRAELRMKLLALRAAHPGMFLYDTRGGSRVIYRLPVPSVIACREDAHQWRQDYATTIAYLRRVFEIDADPACADWTRLFRLPNVTRNGNQECRDFAGSPCDIGALWFLPSEEDVEVANEILPKAFEEPKQMLPSQAVDGGNGDGYGLLYHALRNRGDVFREYRRGMYLIRCPRESDHSSGRTGDSSTVLFLPGPGEHVGVIHCKHAHCVNMSVKDWVRTFSASELTKAAEDAGIPRRIAG